METLGTVSYQAIDGRDGPKGHAAALDLKNIPIAIDRIDCSKDLPNRPVHDARAAALVTPRVGASARTAADAPYPAASLGDDMPDTTAGGQC